MGTAIQIKDQPGSSIVTMLQVWILVLCGITPFLLVFGNIAPPLGGFKIHWFTNGFTTLLICISLFFLLKKWLYKAAFLGVFLVANVIFSINTSITELLNTLSGPLIFVYFIILVEKDLLIIKGAREILYIFVLTSMVPIMIAILQFIGILPFNIWAFNAINITRPFGEPIQRVNGYLYHASELANIAFFIFTILVIMLRRIYIAPLFLFFFAFQIILLIKSSIGGFLILTTYLLVCPIKFDWQVRNLSKIAAVLGAALVILLFGDHLMHFAVDKFLPDSTRNQFYLSPDIFTGRGRIWSIYFYGIAKYFSPMNFIFGGGFGASKHMFDLILPETGILWVADFTPHPHNEFLHLFVNGGAVFMGLYVAVFLWCSKVIKKFNRTPYRLNPITLIVFITAGMTVPISDRFVFWLAFSFLLIAFRLKSLSMERSSKERQIAMS